ncbi:MAG TPA: proton-conducting transporter membrane subunit [Phototrophicaceae bacterium]|nr:proton-conducting transporter membrane subunit [Phototrophicaceae bacterium]
MTPNNPLVLAPIFVPLGAAALSILFAHQRRIQHFLGFTATVLAWLASIGILILNWSDGLQLYRLGGWQPPYGIVLAPDMLSSIFCVMATTVVAAGALYILGCHDKCVSYPAFMPLYLCMAAGLNGAFYTGDIFTLFVFQELMIMSSVVLVGISDNKLGVEAAIKYLLISAMGSLFLLLGIGAIYASFGTLTLADIARLLESGQRPLLAQTAAVMLMCAFLLKSAVFPFHFWQPDFHTAAPTPVHAVLSSVVVKVGVYGLIRLTMLLFIAEAPLVRELLVILGIIGIFFGSLAALRTYDAKRMLAYSTFGQIGFILLGIGWGTPLALIGAIVYAVNHAFIKSSLLMITGALSSRMPNKTAKLTDIVGAGHKFPLMGTLYILGGLALAGVPPMNGFISKLAIIRGGIASQSWLILGLAVAAGLITLMYTMRTWQHVFQRSPEGELHLKPVGDSLTAPLLLIGLCVILGLFALPVVSAATIAVDRLTDPQLYIRSVLGS